MSVTDRLKAVEINEIIDETRYTSSVMDGNKPNQTKEFTIYSFRKVKFKSQIAVLFTRMRSHSIFSISSS